MTYLLFALLFLLFILGVITRSGRQLPREVKPRPVVIPLGPEINGYKVVRSDEHGTRPLSDMFPDTRIINGVYSADKEPSKRNKHGIYFSTSWNQEGFQAAIEHARMNNIPARIIGVTGRGKMVIHDNGVVRAQEVHKIRHIRRIQ